MELRQWFDAFEVFWTSNPWMDYAPAVCFMLAALCFYLVRPRKIMVDPEMIHVIAREIVMNPLLRKLLATEIQKLEVEFLVEVMTKGSPVVSKEGPIGGVVIIGEFTREDQAQTDHSTPEEGTPPVPCRPQIL